MASKPASPAPLSGVALLDSSPPLADTPRGGIETGFDGSTSASKLANKARGMGEIDAVTGQSQQFAGMGSWLEAADPVVFQTANNLVLRQELFAIGHLAIDVHYMRVKRGFGLYSQLYKDPNKDTYRSEVVAGVKSLTVNAVPNQAWDLVNKATEAVMADPPQPDPQPLDDSEQSRAAAKMAERFLTEDSGEQGTNDLKLGFDAVDRALVCSTTYLEGWTDPVGGGYVPLQILAHPHAADPSNPLIGPDGMPTTDPILRYVTAPEGGQFTDNPSEAPPQWQPRIRASLWGREHWRIFPETGPVETAEKVIGLLYCTIAEAKRRWKSVAAMAPDELNQLLGWQPVRFLVLLPPYERARWRMQTGSDTEQSGSADERILFYYRVLQKAAPDHPRGAEVIVTGAMGGKIIDKQMLAAEVEVPSSDGKGQKKDIRCMDIPLVQFTPRSDPEERDPSGFPYISMFSGATEFNATLATGFMEALNLWLHPDIYAPSGSPVEGYQRTESRATGNAIPIMQASDVPQYGPTPPIPPNFFSAVEWNDGMIRSIASLNKPVTGQDSAEVSGKARQIAVQQGMIGLSRMQHPTNAAFERWWRIKLQLAMRDFTAPQTIRYVGEDGAWMQEQWQGTDFALIGSVGIQAGTGTMLPPEQKLQFLANLKAEGMLPADEAADAARPTYAQRLGLPDDPHQQYIERCVTAWLKGAPEGWAQQWTQYTQQKQAYDAQQAQAAQAKQAQAQQQQSAAAAAPEQVKAAAAAQLETQKAQASMQLEQQKHQMALEAKQMDAQIAAQSAQRAAMSAPPPAEPQQPPVIEVQPPDLSEISQALDGITQILNLMVSKEPLAQEPATMRTK